MQFQIPTTDDIRAVVQQELSAFFASNKFQPQTEQDEIGGVEFASRITGKAVPTIYSLTSKNLIPHSKRGKQLYFHKSELLEWISSGRSKTRAEIAATIN